MVPYQKLQNLTQGFKSVEDYLKKMEVVMIQKNMEKDKEAIMTRFLNGLNREITNIIKLHHYIELKDMVLMAMEVKCQLKKRRKIQSQAEIMIRFCHGDQIRKIIIRLFLRENQNHLRERKMYPLILELNMIINHLIIMI